MEIEINVRVVTEEERHLYPELFEHPWVLETEWWEAVGKWDELHEDWASTVDEAIAAGTHLSHTGRQ